MRRGLFAVACLAGLFSPLVLVGLLCFVTKPALAGLQVVSGEMASCAGGGVDVDLVATGTVEDVVASKVSSRVEVRVERILLGDRGYAGETLTVETDSGTNGGNAGAVSFREGARYEIYLQREGDGWKTNTCLGTRELTGSSGNTKSVPETKASTGSPTMPETGGPSLPAIVALAGLVLAGIDAALGWRGRRFA